MKEEILKNGGFSNYKHDTYFAVDKVYIENGFCKSKELWLNNSRVKKMELTYEDGESYILNLEDNMKMQVFEIPHKTTIEKPLEAAFEILEVYEGTKYEDTALTTLHMNFYPIGISTAI